MLRTNLSISVVAMSVLALTACTMEFHQPSLSAETPASIESRTLDDQAAVTPPILEVSGQGSEGSPGEGFPWGEEAGEEGSQGQVNPAWQAQVQRPTVFLVAGAAHACAMTADGEVSCWGRNELGQLGYGHTDAIGDDEPVASYGVVDVGGPVVSLAAGRRGCSGAISRVSNPAEDMQDTEARTMPLDTALWSASECSGPQSAMSLCEVKHGAWARACVTNVQLSSESS